MKATVSEPESWKRVIEIEVPAEELQSSVDEKLKKYKREMKLSGFRPGKVPVSIIKQRYGDAIRAEAIDELVQKTFRDACVENKVNPVSQPKVNELKAPEGESLTFSIETEVDPQIEIKGYNKLKIKASPKKIKDSDVDEAMKNLKERFAEFKNVDRKAKKGDFLNFEYLKVVIDGEERSDVKNPAHPVELGAENKIKDFDKGIIGHSVGETVDISVKFPKDYPDSGVAGKSGDFQIKLNSVQEKVLPEFNEEFLKKLGDFADEKALREQMQKNLEDEEISNAKNEAYDKAIEQLIKDNEFEVPPARVDQFTQYMHQESMKYNKEQTTPTKEELKERYYDTAIKAIKRQRIIDFVANKENIKPSQEDVDNEIQRLATMYNQPFEELKKTFRKNGTTLRIRDDLREQKALDFLIGEYSPEAKKE